MFCIFWNSNNSMNVCLLQSLEVDVDHEIAETDQSEPYIVVTGVPGTQSSQILVCCEGQEFLE